MNIMSCSKARSQPDKFLVHMKASEIAMFYINCTTVSLKSIKTGHTQTK